ncbi:MAG TPA: CPBP family intramembrane glutamic endopeptidase [Pyrinomonadaceae bacterium]|nr:CPBP family intramembrane glutamic endopeptidase [Pyrinomonadaceae bacterium]
MRPKTKLFVILWIAGMTGILSFLLVDLSALLANLPATAGKAMPFSPLGIKLLGVIQPTVLMSIAVLVGTTLARKVGLSAPAAEAVAQGQSLTSALKPQIVPAVIGGFAGGAAIVSIWLIWKRFLPPVFVSQAEKLSTVLPLPTRLLYGGITEELLLRWGVMTFLVWLAWRLFQRGRGRPRPINFVIAIVISSVVFGMGHLPVASALGAGLTMTIVAYVVIANSIFGLVAGYLYWQRGLEAAIMAHMSAHVLFVTLMYLRIT